MTSHEFAFNLAGHIIGVKKKLRRGAAVTFRCVIHGYESRDPRQSRCPYCKEHKDG